MPHLPLPCSWIWEQLLPKLPHQPRLLWQQNLGIPQEVILWVLSYLIQCLKGWNRGNVMILVDPYPFSSHTWPSMCLEETGMISHKITPWLVHFSFHNLVRTSFLGQNLRSRSADLYLPCFPFQQTITSNNTSPYSIILFHPSTYSNLGIFLVCLPIVLSLRKAPIGLVYKPVHVSLFPLASSIHHPPGNLVSSLVLPV